MKHTSHIFLFILCLAASISHAQLPAYLPANGLVAWYPFNGNANDESGNGNNGAVNGALLTIDRFSNSNSAYDFDGINNEILIQHNDILNTLPITASCWFKSNTPQQNKMLINKYVCQSYNGYSFQLTVNRPSAFYFSNLSSHYFDNPLDENYLDFNDDTWHHALWIINENEIKIYCDGVIIYYSNSSGPLASTTTNAPLRFGSYAQGICAGSPQNFFYKGQIDDIAIYNRALNEAEVSVLYTSTATNTGGGTTTTTPAPPGIPYQAEVRNDSGEVLANANVNVRFTLHELTASGAVSYQETHAITTNELGLFGATIGAGTATQGTFAGINWAQTTKFLQVEVDAGNGYITMGNQQLMSVPYALYAANGPAGPQGPVGPQGPAGEQGQSGINGLTSLINVSNTLPDSNCPQGGIKIENGLDYNINNILDSTEINSIQTKTICFQNETNSNLNNLIFGSRNISSNSELNNAVTIVSESGNGIWCCGPTHTVPAGKLWKIAGYSGVVSSGLLTGETWLDEGQSITFQGNSNNGGSIPYSFTAFEYVKSELDFSVVSNYGTGIWCCGPSFTVPSGKIWKVIGYSGAVNSGIMNGETWLDEGQSLTFQGNSNNGGGIPFRFIAFEYSK